MREGHLFRDPHATSIVVALVTAALQNMTHLRVFQMMVGETGFEWFSNKIQLNQHFVTKGLKFR